MTNNTNTMIIAQKKRKENIAEYILYMWQMEDTLRALKFDINQVKSLLINRFNQTDAIKAEMTAWYENLIEMMRQEELQEKGHIQAVYNLICDLNDVHKYLLKTPSEGKYQLLYRNVENDIAALRKVQMASNANDIEVCMNFLYGILLLRVKKETITKETSDTLEKVSRMIGLLASKYHDIEQGKIELDL